MLGNFFKFVTLTLSFVHVMSMLKLIPHHFFSCRRFQSSMAIPLNVLFNKSTGFGENRHFLFWQFLFSHHLVFVVASKLWFIHHLSFYCIHSELSILMPLHSSINKNTGLGQHFCFLFVAYISQFPFHFVMRFYRCVCCEDLHRPPLWRLQGGSH